MWSGSTDGVKEDPQQGFLWKADVIWTFQSLWCSVPTLISRPVPNFQLLDSADPKGYIELLAMAWFLVPVPSLILLFCWVSLSPSKTPVFVFLCAVFQSFVVFLFLVSGSVWKMRLFPTNGATYEIQISRRAWLQVCKGHHTKRLISHTSWGLRDGLRDVPLHICIVTHNDTMAFPF